MLKNVLISICGSQCEPGETDYETIQFVTRGNMVSEGDKKIITYAEGELTGMGNTQTTLTVEDNRITLARRGDVYSQMVFEQGRRHLSMLDTDEGSLTLGVNTNKITNTLTDMGGDIEMDYNIEVEHSLTGLNKISIHVSDDLNPSDISSQTSYNNVYKSDPNDKFLH